MEQKYLGIVPYDENSGFDFVGRNDETWALYDRIIRNDYTVYYAASGEGKSSLIRAGLLPILRRRNYYPLYIVLKNEELTNIESIEKIIDCRIAEEVATHKISYEQSEWSESRFSIEQSAILKKNQWWRLRNYCFKKNGVELKPFYVFDQFEEVFTKANYDWTDCFFSWLEEISTDYPPRSLQDIAGFSWDEIPTQKNYKALFSFRTEYLGDLDYWCVEKHFLPALQENRMCLKPLTIKGAREVISLNESSLGAYADKIIQGCTDTKKIVKNESQPCVYALILSVVCHTLSEISDKERTILLEGLGRNQDDTIDDILLRFYKKKLILAGLDPIKDEGIIANIEDAFVDEKGKRSRRDTDEESLVPLKKWVDKLIEKENGLIKEIGRKEAGDVVVRTVELPHDRLCKAIDSSRKERQGKTAWKLNRRSEWIQFCIISTVFGIVAYLWNVLMPLLKSLPESLPQPLLASLQQQPLHSVRDFISNSGMWCSLPLQTVNSISESFSVLFLMVLLILYVPLITIFIVRKSKKWQLLSAAMSFISLLATFLFWGLVSQRIHFTDIYVLKLTVIGFLISVVVLAISINNLRTIYQKGEVHSKNLSNWPLLGGYFIFASCVFYECLCGTGIGVSEPCDSSWALTALPLLFALWVWGFFNMKWIKRLHKRMLYLCISMLLFLFLLSVISYCPYYNTVKQSYGMTVSLLLILLWISILVYIIRHTHSSSKYYLLTRAKRIFIIASGVLVLCSVFLLNLGFNPFVIASNKVCHVASWREVLIYDCDSLENKYIGVVYPTDGDTILPCCVPINVQIDTTLLKGKYPFKNAGVPVRSVINVSPFVKENMNVNIDSSLIWDPENHRMTASIVVSPTLEQYLRQKIDQGLPPEEQIEEQIDYYAAKLFCELREANITFALSGRKYNLDVISSLEKLDSLQQCVLTNELKKFSLDAMSDGVMKRRKIETLEDRDIIGFHRELSRTIILSLIRDRVNKSDMPALFSLSKTYLLSFFTSVPLMRMSFMTDITINEEGISSIKIHSSDILKGKLFAWYDLFRSLCYMDKGWNQEENNRNLKEYLDMLEEVADYYSSENLDEVLRNLGNSLQNMESLYNSALTDVKTEKRDSAWSWIAKFVEEYRYSRQGIDKIRMAKTERERLLGRMQEMHLAVKPLSVDTSLIKLSDSVLKTLLPMLKERKAGIYNNAFENVCKNLIQMSALRGYDISKDQKAQDLSDYLKVKNEEFNDGWQFAEKSFLMYQMQTELEERLEELIKELGELLKVCEEEKAWN